MIQIDSAKSAKSAHAQLRKKNTKLADARTEAPVGLEPRAGDGCGRTKMFGRAFRFLPDKASAAAPTAFSPSTELSNKVKPDVDLWNLHSKCKKT